MNANDCRELQKVLDTLIAVEKHLNAKDEMNAALHMSEMVRATPLAASVRNSVVNLNRLIDGYENI